MPTIADNYQSINQILTQLGNELIEQINQFYVTREKKVTFTGNNNTTQQGQDVTLSATVTDLKNNAIENIPVKFYIDEDYNSEDKNININGGHYTQIDDTIFLTSSVTDSNNNPIKGQYVHFYIDDYSIEQSVQNNIDALINAIDSIPAIEVENDKNIKPVNILQIDDTNLSTFKCTLYQSILYYMELLAYYLALKGVPLNRINNVSTLKGLIDLIPLIDAIKPSILNITPIEETQYYGTSIYIEYFLKDIDGFDIEEGDITIQDSNGITYDSVTAGNQLRFTPMTVSPKINGEYQSETYTVMYHGSDKYTASCKQTFTVKIVPTSIRLKITATNISDNSRYYRSTSIGYETDTWQIKIQALDHQGQPIANMPFKLTMPGFLDDTERLTDENGTYMIKQVINQTGNHTLTCKTLYEDTELISNVTKQLHINIKYNILKQSQYEYTDYTGKNNYTYELKIINEDTGELDAQYNGQSIDVFLTEEVEKTTNGEVYYSKEEKRQGTVIITNSKAIFTFNNLSVGDKQIRWTFNTNSFTTHSNTTLHILSNFILPKKTSYFLQDTPEIVYAPLGNINANNEITGIIEYDIVTYNETVTGYEQAQVVVGYETETVINYLYKTKWNEETEEFEYVLDEHNQPIPIYEVDDNDNLILDENNQPIQAYEIEEVEVLYKTQYNSSTEQYEFILDGNNQPIRDNDDPHDEHSKPMPIYETINTDPIIELIPNYQHHEENVTFTTDSNGILNGISSYKDIGQYKISLASSNGLNENIIFEYELKQPFDINLYDYSKKEQIIYDITIYDMEHYSDDCISVINGYNFRDVSIKNSSNITQTNDDINITASVVDANNDPLENVRVNLYSLIGDNNTFTPAENAIIVMQHLYDITPTSSTDEYTIMRVTIPAISNTFGFNTIDVNVNNYKRSKTWQFINKNFTLLTSTVSLGEDTIQIQCNDESVTSIDIESEYIVPYNITYENGIFNVFADFKKGGTISFNVTDNYQATETFTIIVDKKDLLPSINASVNVKNPADNNSTINNIAMIDMSRAYVLFDIDEVINSDLSINYMVDNNIIQTFTYYSSDSSEKGTNNALILPSTLKSGTHNINFTCTGNDTYKQFNKNITFTIFKSQPTHTIANKYSAYKS